MSAERSGRARRVLGAVLSLATLLIALWFLHHELRNLTLAAILAQMRSLSPAALSMACAAAAGSYLVLTGYDALGMRYIRRKIPYRHTAQTAFMAFAVGHNVGLAALSGGSVRYRMYSLLGLSGFEIAAIIAFTSVTFGLGASLLLGLAITLMPATDSALLSLPLSLMHAIGAVLMAVPALYVLMAFAVRRPLTVGRWRFSVPTPTVAVTQLILSVFDLCFAATTLYVLLAPELSIGFFPFLGIFLIALAAGLASSVPGGIGVFEAMLMLGLPDVGKPALLATIIIYRLIYYVAPLCLALLLLTINEIKQHRHVLVSSTGKLGNWLTSIVPQVVSGAVFLAGVVLLVSGSVPAIESRLNYIAQGIPLPVLELSHLTGSVLGVGLLVLARGLSRRLRGAYIAALAVLAGGIVASLLKGLDMEEAAILATIAVVLWISRAEFYRLGSVVSQRYTAGWVMSIVLVLCFAWWVALISFRHVNYSQQLWWQFALHADAPRTLRAILVAGMTAASFALWKLFHAPRRALGAKPAAAELQHVRDILRTCREPAANAALLGDKRFHFSTSGQAFIMYRISGKSWVALGDPAGPLSEWEDLTWSFREMVDRYDGHSVFYHVSGETLPLFVDMGMGMAKIGEEARVPLGEFSLEGSKNAKFRQARNKALKGGAVFEIVPAARVGQIAAELREVSDAWLDEKRVAEKSFSLGSFSEPYIGNFDCAVVRLDGSVVAFANLWNAPAGGEFSVDMMRFNHRAPNGIMDFLFTELMLWGKEQGYAWFNLGMAPLAGLEQHVLAPLWHKLGNLIFNHGESFYNFEGLRNYKDKFRPEWNPCYIAYPAGVIGLPRALLDTSRLISGGVGKLLDK